MHEFSTARTFVKILADQRDPKSVHFNEKKIKDIFNGFFELIKKNYSKKFFFNFREDS